ncbi:hypothetical protein [Rhodanobacter thiooxydans]|nr:hypothetical protein [Rhodanobacter thiooxydans]EIM02951.1 hypothetical protein UUA_00605 [Rhodanobacter thiooxydans LCS2]MCW0203838.1 hypothetical protein [Rhodanobacter thiooxydans]
MGEGLPRQPLRGHGPRAAAAHRAGMAAGRIHSGCPRWALLVSLLVAALAGAPPSHAHAAAGDTHRPRPATQRQLQLDRGQRWPADAALREGMRRIRAVALWMQQAQADGPLSVRQSRAATASIEDSVAVIVDHPPRGNGMDANLHLLLGRVLTADGLPQLLDALELYPRYFTDPDWQPLTASAPAGHGQPDDTRESTHATQP